MIGFFIGLFLGVFFGVAIMAILIMGRQRT